MVEGPIIPIDANDALLRVTSSRFPQDPVDQICSIYYPKEVGDRIRAQAIRQGGSLTDHVRGLVELGADVFDQAETAVASAQTTEEGAPIDLPKASSGNGCNIYIGPGVGSQPEAEA